MPDWNFEPYEEWTGFDFECDQYGKCTRIRGYRNNESDQTIGIGAPFGPPFPVGDEAIEAGLDYNPAKLFKSLQTGTLPESLVRIKRDGRTVRAGVPYILGNLRDGTLWSRDGSGYFPAFREALMAGDPVRAWYLRSEAVSQNSLVFYGTSTEFTEAEGDTPGGLPIPPALPVPTSYGISSYDYFKTGADIESLFPDWHRVENYNEPSQAFEHTFLLTVSFGVRQGVSYLDYNTAELANELLYHYRLKDSDDYLAFDTLLTESEADNFGVDHASVYVSHGSDAIHANRIQLSTGTPREYWNPSDKVSTPLSQGDNDLPHILNVNSLNGYPVWEFRFWRNNANNRRQVDSRIMKNPAGLRSLHGEGENLTSTSIHSSFTSYMHIKATGEFHIGVFPSDFEGADSSSDAWTNLKDALGPFDAAWLFKAVTYARSEISVDSDVNPTEIGIERDGEGFFQGDLLHFQNPTTNEVIGEAYVSADASNNLVSLSANALPMLPAGTKVFVEHMGDERKLRYLNFYRSHHADSVGWFFEITPGGGNVLQPEIL